ncbi:MAG: hypothetical protein B7Y90_02780 [Alphaproteobacteria bacterium 32-64-14]|nr:MAG: hypothetical protein B7Y90_02780 [Alphaproteobacteria bacterium 32-64-14]
MLCDWLDKGQLEFPASSSTVIARSQATALKRCLFFIEGMLRRLVLVGAALWCGPFGPSAQTKTQPAKPAHAKPGLVFRLFAVSKPLTPRAPTPRIICLNEKFLAPPLPLPPPKLRLPAWGADPLLNVGRTPPQATPPAYAPGPLQNTVIRHDAPPAPYIPLRDRWDYDWGSGPAPVGSRVWRPRANHAPVIDWREMPATIPAASLFARLAHAAKLITNPERLIRRAARLFERRRQLALLLARTQDPTPRGSINEAWSGQGVPALRIAMRFLRGVLCPAPDSS